MYKLHLYTCNQIYKSQDEWMIKSYTCEETLLANYNVPTVQRDMQCICVDFILVKVRIQYTAKYWVLL